MDNKPADSALTVCAVNEGINSFLKITRGILLLKTCLFVFIAIWQE